MAKQQTVYISVENFPKKVVERIKRHLDSIGVRPTNSTAVQYACTQFVEQVLDKQPASSGG